MSVADVFSSAASDGRPTIDRTPPQDVEAEMCVLGAMLLSKDAVADVVEILHEADFYKPAHQTVFAAIVDLFSRGEPADSITVADQLAKSGELLRVGGAPYLHTLSARVPVASNAGYYGRIVAEQAILRRMVEAGTRIAQMGYAAEGEVDDLVDRAEYEIYQVSERRTQEDYQPLEFLMHGAIEEIEAIHNRGGQLVGVPTGFADLDELTNGLHPGQMVIVAARPAIGKALELGTPLATPTGWTTMGDVQVGDLLLGADGRPTKVVAATEVMVDRPCFRLSFDDGSELVADAEHQWLTDTSASRRAAHAAAAQRGWRGWRGAQGDFGAIRTTEELAAAVAIDNASHRLNHSIKAAMPLQLKSCALPLSPYVLGVWLGAGHVTADRINVAEPEIVMHVEAEGFEAIPSATRSSVHTLRFADRDQTPLAVLRELGLTDNKHIPVNFLRASEQQRRNLLAGLLDTRATVTRSGSVRLRLVGDALTGSVLELLHSLGYRATVTTKPTKGVPVNGATYTITFMTSDELFRVESLRLQHKQLCGGYQRRSLRYITKVERIESVPVRCVEVDNADHMYLAGRSMIPTHNSTLGLDIARSASIKHGLTSAIFSLEMSANEIIMRLLSAEAGINLKNLRNGKMHENEWMRLARAQSEIAEKPLFIDDSPNMTLMEIRAKCRRLKQRHDLRLVIVDYLQLMTSGKRVESRQQEVSEFSRSLKLLAKELEVPVIAISQLNRGPEQRTDKKPMLSDLRESGCLTADTRIVRADTGAEVTMGSLHASGERDIPVWALDDSLRYVRSTMTHVFPTGNRRVFTLQMASGRRLRATSNHRFLTVDGWKPLSELPVGCRIGTARHVPAPIETHASTSDELIVLAYSLGDGSANDDTSAAVMAAAKRLQVEAARASLKAVPAWVSQLPKEQIALFLRHLWGADGSIVLGTSGAGGTLRYGTSSRALADDVAMLLLRFGIIAHIRCVPSDADGVARDYYTVDIYEAADQKVFLRRIGLHGENGRDATEMLARISGGDRPPAANEVPKQVWGAVQDILKQREVSYLDFQATLMTKQERIGQVAAVLDSADLEILATNDLQWDEIVAIDPAGVEDVYDATVLGRHNFIANGIAAHNSLEQDADMVMLLHREDVYDREQRPGEADFIVAKHRNGPTATITVAFQGHYSRFVDMANE